MPKKAAFFTFLFAAFMLNIAPGPDMLYVIGRSVGQGRKAGIVSSLGVFVGCWVHILAAAFGIAALLRSSPVAFNVVRYAGAAYLIYLGIKMVAKKKRSLLAATSAGEARQYLPPGRDHQRAQSQSRDLLPGVSAPVY